MEAYIKVPELSKNGKQHLHVLFRGKYIDQAYLSSQWQEIHKAKIVDIRKVKYTRTKKQIGAYMAKYMSKENTFRYAWSWSWVWRGFCRHWTLLKRAWRYQNYLGMDSSFQELIQIWGHFLRCRSPGPLLDFLTAWGGSKAELENQ